MIFQFLVEKLSKKEGGFIYISKSLMGHRISEETTTTEIIRSGIRTKEDYIMFRKFWPNTIAKILTMLYKQSEKNNSVNE